MDVGGVGYEVNISLNTYEAISKKEKGLLYTYLHITENSQVLFGFHEQTEKDLFLHLISVSGVGASTARMMLSGMQPEEIIRAIVNGEARLLEQIKGIGKKSAERLVLELRDKLSKIPLNAVLSFFLPAVSVTFLVKSIFVCACKCLFAKSKTPKIKNDFKIRNE